VPADTTVVKRHAWVLYLVLGIVTTLAYLFVHPIRVGLLFNALGLSASLVILIGVQINRPSHRLPWYLFAIGQTLFVAGDVITYNYERLFGSELPFPSLGDVFYLSVYPCLIAGLLLLIHQRSPGRDRASAIDSLIVAVGVGVISWVFLMAPIAHDSDLNLVAKLVSIAYPLMDLMILTAAIRLAVGIGTRPTAFYLMALSIVALFVTDSIYSWISVHGIVYDNTSGYLEGGWALFYLLWGAAALHPSMRKLEEPAPEPEVKNPRLRLYFLAGASLMAPAVELFQALRGEQVDVPVLAGCSSVLFILVVARLKGLMVDVDEHRKTERQLRDAETKYRTLVEGLPAVVYIAEFGEEGPWRYVSPQIESILGFTQAEFMSAAKFWREQILPEDREQALAAELQIMRGEGRMQCEYRIRGPQGRVIWIREEAEALMDERGRPAYLQGVMYDVTEQKDSEGVLRQALETEKEATKRLTTLHEMQNSFLQAVSHDLRTPLTSILGSALTLEQSGDTIAPEDQQDLIRRMASNARKLRRLLTNLLDLDRMSRGTIEPNRGRVDLTLIAATVIQECNVESHPIELRSTEPMIALVDADQTERIIENLVTNAVRYTPPETPIWVTVESFEDGAMIRVEDAGPGVRDDLKATIFEPFRQGDEVVAHSPGVGIGLSLVARFARLHGGRAWVEDRAGGGASFRVYLPNETPAQASREDSTPTASVEESAATPSEERPVPALTTILPKR
jgi:PAS domain S-box-containing protein